MPQVVAPQAVGRVLEEVAPLEAAEREQPAPAPRHTFCRNALQNDS